MVQVLYALAIVACPAGMGLMIWLMMRSGRRQSDPGVPSAASEAEVKQLHADLDELRARQPIDKAGAGILQTR